MSAASNASSEQRQAEEEKPRQQMYMSQSNHAMSVDTSEEYQPPSGEVHRGSRPPVSSFNRHTPTSSSRFPPRYPEARTRQMPHRLQPAVTASFSTEERDGAHAGVKGPPVHRLYEQRFDHAERYVEDEQREDWNSPRYVQHSKPPSYGSPQNAEMGPPPPPPPRMSRPHTVQRAYSSPGYYHRPESLKRSYFHHSGPTENFSVQELPTDFMPPKRAKLGPPLPQKETVVTPSRASMRRPEGQGHGEWRPRNGTWDSEESRYKYISRSNSYPVPPSWSAPYREPSSPSSFNGSPEKYGEISPRTESDSPNRRWNLPGHFWGGPSPRTSWISPKVGAAESQWSSPSHHDLSYSEHKSKDRAAYEPERRNNFTRQQDHHRSGLLDLGMEGVAPTRGDTGSRGKGGDDQQDAMRTVKMPNGDRVLLLALGHDRVSLSETLCVVREVR